jgi:hypothetical protein
MDNNLKFDLDLDTQATYYQAHSRFVHRSNELRIPGFESRCARDDNPASFDKTIRLPGV